MSAQINFQDEDEFYIAQEQSLQYYLNMFLDDSYHKDFRQYLALSGEEISNITEDSVFEVVEEFKDYFREVTTDYEDLYMTAGY